MALARLLDSDRPRLLFVNLAIGGGTEKHVQDLACLLEARFEVLILRPDAGDRVKLEWSRRGEDSHLLYALPSAFDDLVRLLQALNVARLHFHHLLGHHPIVAQLPGRLGVPYDFTLHDYFPICPQFNLTRADGRYCGEPDNDGCNTCLAERPAPWRLDIAGWRHFFAQLLNGAERVIGPSRDVINRTQVYLPQAPFVYLPHPESRDVKVLVLGRLSPAKGGHQLEACARDALSRRLPLGFRVLGSAAYDNPPQAMPDAGKAALPLSFSGPYEDGQLARLITAEQADMIYFPAQWPETYSYTLSAALRSGLPIVAPRLGAFEERLATYPQAHFLEWDAAPAVVNDRLLAVAERAQSAAAESECAALMHPRVYLERYTEAIEVSRPARRPVSGDPLDELLPVALIHPHGMIEVRPSDQEAERTAPRQPSAGQEQQPEEPALLIQALQTQLEERDNIIKALYASRSWRLTRPWRWLGWNLRRLKGRLKRR
jgi:glycosyltransferase involved in cell wall biosynthesis